MPAPRCPFSPASTLALALPHAYKLPPDLLHKAQRLGAAHAALYFGGTAWMLLMLFLLVRGRAGERIAQFAERASGNAWVQGLIAVPVWLAIISLLSLPVSLLSHHVSIVYHLSIESWGLWAVDWLKSTAMTLLIGALVLPGLYGLMRRSPRRWWVWFWLFTLPFEVLGVYAAPVVVDPLFNHFTPLMQKDPALVASLEKVVAKSGLAIPPERMFVMDASTRYTGMNAYVTGFGGSKRVVVWDTTLTGAPQDEILAIYGHEQGHYVLGHIWKGMLYSAVLLFFFYWLAYRLLRWLVRLRGDAWHIASPENYASLGLVLLLATALGFLADPLGNIFSRHIEHQADVYGQEVIHSLVADPQALEVADFNRLGRVWLEDPAPDPFIVWWTYSHPPTGERADFAAAYNPWSPGQHPRYVAPTR